MKEQRLYQRWYGHLPFIVLLLLTTVMNFFVKMHGDDLLYSTQFSLFPIFKGQEPTFANILNAQIYDYLHINGRLLIHVFCSLVLTKGLWLWQILNPLFVLALAYTLFYAIHVRLPKREDVWQTTLITALLFLAHGAIINQSINYATGTFNYLYPMVYVLALISFFRRYDVQAPISNRICLVFAILLGFITGWSQEQISLLAVGFMLIWFIKNWIRKEQIYPIHIAIFCSTLIGSLFLFLAPGFRERANLPVFDYYNELSFAKKILSSLPGVIRFILFQEATCLVLILILSGALCYKISKRAIWRNIPIFLLTPFIFFIALLAIKMLGRWNVVSTYIKTLDHWYIISTYGLLCLAAIFIMNAYLSARKGNYLFVTLASGFIMASLIMIFTPATSGGRIAFPSFVLGIGLISLALQHWENSCHRNYLVVSLVLLAVINYAWILRGWVIRWLVS